MTESIFYLVHWQKSEMAESEKSKLVKITVPFSKLRNNFVRMTDYLVPVKYV